MIGYRRSSGRGLRRWWSKGRQGNEFLPGYVSQHYRHTSSAWLDLDLIGLWCTTIWGLAIIGLIVSSVFVHSFLWSCVFGAIFVLNGLGAALFAFDLRWWRLAIFVVTVAFCFLGYKWALDLPNYLHHNYAVVQGYPDYVSVPTRGEFYTISISGETFYLQLDHVPMENYAAKWFIVHYLPQSKFVVDYQMLEK